MGILKRKSKSTAKPAAVRNAEYERRMRAAGLTRVSVWVPPDCKADLQELAEHLVANRDLRPNAARNIRTGRMISLHRRPAP
jgi:hypothetical protein